MEDPAGSQRTVNFNAELRIVISSTGEVVREEQRGVFREFSSGNKYVELEK